eukprot:UN28043
MQKFFDRFKKSQLPTANYQLQKHFAQPVIHFLSEILVVDFGIW